MIGFIFWVHSCTFNLTLSHKHRFSPFWITTADTDYTQFFMSISKMKSI